MAAIEDYYVRQASVTEELAKVENQLAINNITSTPQKAEVTVSYSYKDGEKTINIPIEIANPHLWMPNGWGEPALYDFEAQVKVDGKVIASKQERIGLRNIRVVKEKDAQGESFYFEVNGKPMFAKGANFIPDDASLPNFCLYHLSVRPCFLEACGGGSRLQYQAFAQSCKFGHVVWK